MLSSKEKNSLMNPANFQIKTAFLKEMSPLPASASKELNFNSIGYSIINLPQDYSVFHF